MLDEAEKTHHDDEVLAGLGYRQEFKREFKTWEVFGIAFSIIGLFPSTASTLGLSLPNGGPAALVWAWLVCSCMGFIVACALAELASAAPTAGGLYFWTFIYASPRWRYLLSWIVGYANTMGLTAGIASTEWACAVQLLAAVSIGSNFTYTPTMAHIFAVFVAIFIVTALCASLATRTIARSQSAYLALNVFLCLAIIVALPISTPSDFKNSASYVFGHFTSLSQWPAGFSFVLGFVGPLWTMGGYDGPVHMSEEASNAPTAVPTAIVSSLSFAVIMGFGVNLSLAFNMGTDIQSIMDSPIGQPMATIFFNSFGTRGTLVIWAFVVLAQFVVGANYLVACSRQAFAFSRDGALPLSRYLYRMNSYTQTPVNCVWAITTVGILFGLLAFVGPIAINAIFSLGIVGSYTAFAIPILSRLLGGGEWKPGPFNLGRLSIPIAVIAAAWTVFAIVMVMFPSNPGPNETTMNYTVVVGGGWIGLCVIYYFFPRYGGRYWFTGPVANIKHESQRSESVDIMEVKEVDISAREKKDL